MSMALIHSLSPSAKTRVPLQQAAMKHKMDIFEGLRSFNLTVTGLMHLTILYGPQYFSPIRPPPRPAHTMFFKKKCENKASLSSYWGKCFRFAYFLQSLLPLLILFWALTNSWLSQSMTVLSATLSKFPMEWNEPELPPQPILQCPPY